MFLSCRVFRKAQYIRKDAIGARHSFEKLPMAIRYEPTRSTGSVAASTASSCPEIKLTLVNLLHKLDADEDAPRVVELFETEHWPNPGFDASVILFHNII